MNAKYAIPHVLETLRGYTSRAPKSQMELVNFISHYDLGQLLTWKRPVSDSSDGRVFSVDEGIIYVEQRALPPLIVDLLEGIDHCENYWKFYELIRPALAESRQKWLRENNVLSACPFLDSRPRWRCFSMPWILMFALPGVPSTRGGLHKWISKLPEDHRLAGNCVFWGAFPAEWRRQFSVRWTNAMNSIGHHYMTDGFASEFFARLLPPAESARPPSEGRAVLVSHMREAIKLGLSQKAAIQQVIADVKAAPIGSTLARASLEANAKRRGLSERSLRRWLSESLN